MAIWSYLHPSISTALMRPRRPKQYCLQLVLYIYILTTGLSVGSQSTFVRTAVSEQVSPLVGKLVS